MWGRVRSMVGSAWDVWGAGIGGYGVWGVWSVFGRVRGVGAVLPELPSLGCVVRGLQGAARCWCIETGVGSASRCCFRGLHLNCVQRPKCVT